METMIGAEKNIWYVHPYAGGPGVGRYSRPYYLGRHWKSAGVNATIFTPAFHHLLDEPKKAGHADIEGVTYRFIDAPKYLGNGLGRLRNMFLFSWRLYRRADDYVAVHGKPDVIIASSPHPYAFLATHALARRYRATSIFEVRDLWPLSLIELGGVSRFHPFIKFTGWVEKYAYRHAHYTVSLLPLTLDYMTKKRLTKERWLYIPNGIDANEIDDVEKTHPCVEQAQRLRERGQVVVTYAGALGRPNHLEALIRATRLLKDNGVSNVSVIIVGRGEQEEKLKELVIDLDVMELVHIYSQVPKTTISTLLRESNVGYISLRPEAIFRFGVSPNKLFDYMLAGLPVIFAVDAGNDPVTEAGCGFTVPAGDDFEISDALKRISKMTDGERLEMGGRGRRYVLENHDYRSLARRYLERLQLEFGSCK